MSDVEDYEPTDEPGDIEVLILLLAYFLSLLVAGFCSLLATSNALQVGVLLVVLWTFPSLHAMIVERWEP